MNFWENVDAELEFKGINRKTLAQEAGFDASLITKGIKTGSAPSADTAVRIAKILNVSVEYLVTGQLQDAQENQTAAIASFHRCTRFNFARICSKAKRPTLIDIIALSRHKIDHLIRALFIELA